MALLQFTIFYFFNLPVNNIVVFTFHLPAGNSGLLMTNAGRGRGARKRGLDSSQNLGANKKAKGYVKFYSQ